MGIPFDIENSTLFREAFAEKAERVRQETVDAAITALQRRFNQDVPGDLRERLETCTREELLGVMVRTATASSAEEALDSGPDDGSVSLAPR